MSRSTTLQATGLHFRVVAKGCIAAGVSPDIVNSAMMATAIVESTRINGIDGTVEWLEQIIVELRKPSTELDGADSIGEIAGCA